MSESAPLIRTEAGIEHRIYFEDDGTMITSASQDCTAILDLNKAMATENDGYTPSREMRRVASIPLILIYKWRTEEGWDAFNPKHADRLARKLNDPEYAYLRTAPGRVAALPGGGLR
jgi:hypothetical protein